MPFASEKQRRYLWAKEPEVARRWTKKYGLKPKKKASFTSLAQGLRRERTGGRRGGY